MLASVSQRVVALVAFLAVGSLLVTPASATKPAARVVAIDAAPVLGQGAPMTDGWFTVTVRLANLTDAEIGGNVEVRSELRWVRDDAKATTRAPFAIPGRGEVVLQLPTHGFVDSGAEVTVRVLGANDEVLAAQDLQAPGPMGPALLDFGSPSRIAAGVRGAAVAAEYEPSPRMGGNYPTLAVASVPTVGKTGDPALPDRAAGYASVTTVLAKSEQVTRLTGPELGALADWVLGGGALALVISRPEDLRHPTLAALVGGSIAPGPANAALTRTETFLSVPRTSSYGRPTPVQITAAPTEETAAALVGFAGGALRPSPWGASATYGLGEVHLLAFDATRAPFVDDRWVQLKMIDLLRHSWERQAHVALPHAGTPLDRGGMDEVRKVLDPNEGARWAIVIAALGLLVYAVFAGPVNFMRAASRQRPLRALLHLPIWAVATTAFIVGLGAISKGVTGRARHLTLIEAGAGVTKGAITRFRGFYAASAGEITVQASHAGNVLDVAGETDDSTRVVVVDRDGARLERMNAKPWQTVVVREDGFAPLGGGISVVKKHDGTVIVNRAARDLVGVVARVPGEGTFLLAKVADGSSVRVADGRALSTSIGQRGGGPRELTALLVDSFASELDATVAKASRAWAAIEATSHGTVDWWPEDVPIVLGQLEGGEGRTSDSGLRLEQDRLLVRIVGWGGVP